MRRIVAGFFSSLDGVVEAPDTWHFPFVDDEILSWVSEQNTDADAMLFGRVAYDSFAAVWPHRTGPLADHFNSITKYVVSRTRASLEWPNSELLRGDTSAAVTDLKDSDGGDIAISGCTTLVRWLLARGLIDEPRLLVHPVIHVTGAQSLELRDVVRAAPPGEEGLTVEARPRERTQLAHRVTVAGDHDTSDSPCSTGASTSPPALRSSRMLTSSTRRPFHQ